MFFVPMTRNSAELNRSFERLFDEGLFDRFLAPTRAETSGTPGARSPALEVSEAERCYTVRLDLPGVSKEVVKIAIDGRRVSVEAQPVRNDDPADGDRLLYTERASTGFARSFTLPVEVDQADSSARMEHGVLTLTLAKRGASQARQLAVS